MTLQRCRISLAAGTVLWKELNIQPHMLLNTTLADIERYIKGDEYLTVNVEGKNYLVKVVDVLGRVADIPLIRPNKNFWRRNHNFGTM